MSAVIGIDLGGTKVAAASLLGDALSESVVHPTVLSDSSALIDQLVALVGEVRGGAAVEAVGLGVPSVIEFDTGRVVSSVNVPLADVPLRQVLGDRLGVPVFVDNDATVAALAEAHDERLRMAARNLVMLTIGTGVGGGIVLNGRIYRGATGGAGELGHTLVAAGFGTGGLAPARVGGGAFPQPGSLESVASGHALDRMASGIGLGSGGEVFRAVSDGDARAGGVYRAWASAIGIGIANAINTFDPEEVVIGGGASADGDTLLAPAREAALGYVVPGLGKRTTIRLARHGQRAGVLGAALLARHELDGVTP